MRLLTLDDHVRRFRIRLAVKVTLAAIVCALIGFVFHLSLGYLSPVIVVLVSVAFRDQVVKAGIPGYLAVLVAGGVALVICGVLIDARMALVLCMLAWLFVWMAFLVHIPLGRILGGIVIAMTLLTVAIGSGRPEALVTAFWTQVLIGTAVAIAFDRLMWPPSATDAVYETLAAVFDRFSGVAETLSDRLRERRPAPRAPSVTLTDIANISSLLRHTVSGKSEAVFQLKFRLWLIWDRKRNLERQMQMRAFAPLPDRLISDVGDIVADFASHFRDLAEAALHRRRAMDMSEETRRKVENLVASLRDVRFREAGVTDATHPAATLITFMSLALADHIRLANAYNAVLESKIVNDADAAKTGVSLAGPFAWPTADDYKTSAKITLIMLILLVGVLYLDFPGSTLVAFYGILFGMTVNLGQLYMKGRTGLFGVVAGLAYSAVCVFLVAQSPHLPLLLGLFALGIFVSVYVASGAEASTFMGLQAALLIPYAFLIFEGPEWTLADALTRAAALAVAAVVAVVVQRLLWPVDPLIMFRKATARALDAMAVAWEHQWQSGRSAGWKSGRSAEDRALAAGPAFPEALIQPFCDSAVWLKDSRYLVGSGHVAARRYARVLGRLEELLAELSLIDRLLRSNPDGTLMARANDQLKDTVVLIATAFEALASYYREPRNLDELIELRGRLAHVQEGSDRHPDADGSVSIEDRRTVSVLLHTIGDLAESLAATVDATMEVPGPAGRRPAPLRPPPGPGCHRRSVNAVKHHV